MTIKLKFIGEKIILYRNFNGRVFVSRSGPRRDEGRQQVFRSLKHSEALHTNRDPENLSFTTISVRYSAVYPVVKLLPMPNGHSEVGGAQDNFHLLGGATTDVPHFDLNSVIPK